MHQGRKADGRDLPRNLGDPDGPAELIGGFAADNNAADIAERAVDDEPSFLPAKPNRLGRRNRLVLYVPWRHGARNAEDADTTDIAETVLDLFERGGRFQKQL